MKKIALLAAVLLMLPAIGCTQDVVAVEQDDLTVVQQEEDRVRETMPEQTPEEPAVDPREAIDLSLRPNEMGRVMVLMYHNIGNEESDWVRTPENFRKDLQTLYDRGYRPISLTDLVSGNITTEAGMTPVVLTFDDTPENNLRFLPDGRIDPLCAIGILLDFQAAHPDFPLEATFFADGPTVFGPKDQQEEKVNRVIELGMDIGNHTVDHVNFKGTDEERIQSQIGRQAAALEELIACESYRVNTLSLPYGSRPDEALEHLLRRGTWEDVAYENVAIVNVGSNPARSPFDERFDPLSIPRVRASEMNVGNLGMYSYLDWFEAHPEERFISDGNPSLVTFPEWVGAPVRTDNREIYRYALSQGE